MLEHHLERIPLNTLAIAFGLAGLAEVWTAGADVLGLPSAIGWTLWAVAAVAWLWLLAAHTVRGARTHLPLGEQLRHPVQGPIASLVPVVALLLGSALHRLQAPAGTVVIGVAFTAAAVFAAWILALWMHGGGSVDAIHGGYFLPTVAAGFIGASAAQEAGWHRLALGAFVVGVVFWVMIQTIFFARLVLRPPLPAPLAPTLAIMAAPPAVGGLAWFAIRDGRIDTVQVGFAGVLVLMLLVQLFFLPCYHELPFSLGFWSFTFPFAAAGAYGVEWARHKPGPLGSIAAVVILVAITALIVAIAVRSVVAWLRDRARGQQDREEEILAEADEEAVR